MTIPSTPSLPWDRDHFTLSARDAAENPDSTPALRLVPKARRRPVDRRKLLRIVTSLRDSFVECSAPTALSCRVHGDCACLDPEEIWATDCSLHGTGTDHIADRIWD